MFLLGPDNQTQPVWGTKLHFEFELIFVLLLHLHGWTKERDFTVGMQTDYPANQTGTVVFGKLLKGVIYYSYELLLLKNKIMHSLQEKATCFYQRTA